MSLLANTPQREAIDESACSACAGTVHADFQTAGQKQDFGILTAQFNDGVGAGQQVPDRSPRGVNLLHKGNM